jgi:hypothetical protein
MIKVSMTQLNQLIKENSLTVQQMAFIYNTYGIGFIIKDGQLKGFTK